MKVFFVLRLYDLLNKGRVCDDVWMSLRRCKGINIVHGVLICHCTEITSDNCAFVMLRRSPLSNKGSSFSKAQIASEKYFSWIFSSSERLKAVVSDITRQHPSTFILPWAEIEKNSWGRNEEHSQRVECVLSADVEANHISDLGLHIPSTNYTRHWSFTSMESPLIQK